MGEANAAAIVTVNGQSITRDGKFFHKSITGTGSTYVGTWTLDQIVENNPSARSSSATGSAWIEPGMTTFTYDLDGNLTQDDRWTYTWDGENRLIQMETKATDVPANLPRQKLVFRYDHRSRRTEKEVWLKNGSGTYVKQKHWKFTYDGWNLIAERDTMTTSVQRTYQWGTDLSGTLQGAGGVGGLLSITSSASGNTSLGRYCYDGNGNITGVVDASLTPGTFAAYEYGPFGETLRSSGMMANANPFRYSTHYTDQETGLAYAKRRYYSTTNGQWLSRDPSGEASGFNLLAYVSNNPITRYDPFGLEEVSGNGSLDVGSTTFKGKILNNSLMFRSSGGNVDPSQLSPNPNDPNQFAPPQDVWNQLGGIVPTLVIGLDVTIEAKFGDADQCKKHYWSQQKNPDGAGWSLDGGSKKYPHQKATGTTLMLQDQPGQRVALPDAMSAQPVTKGGKTYVLIKIDPTKLKVPGSPGNTKRRYKTILTCEQGIIKGSWEWGFDVEWKEDGGNWKATVTPQQPKWSK